MEFISCPQDVHRFGSFPIVAERGAESKQKSFRLYFFLLQAYNRFNSNPTRKEYAEHIYRPAYPGPERPGTCQETS
jgi:hypothetical protein